MNRSDQLRQRLQAAWARLERIPATGPGELGAPDPATGERWHRGNVLGHVAEMLPFWAAQAELALGGARVIGRDQAGSTSRREGIDKGAVLPEAELRAEVARGVAAVERILGAVGAEDLERRIVYRRSDGVERELGFGDFLEEMMIGHFEGHLDQLEELG